jgi:hypothetical protein
MNAIPLTGKHIHHCAICGKGGSGKHHFVPRKARKEHAHAPGQRPKYVTMPTCRACHDDIHYHISHWELAVFFNTQENLITELARRKQLDSEMK